MSLYSEREAGKTPDLRLQTYELLSMVREPSTEEQEALKARGIVFFPVDTRSYPQIVAGDPSYFVEEQVEFPQVKSSNHEPVFEKPAFGNYALPVATQVGLNPTELAIPGSFNRTTNEQLEMTEARSQVLQKEFPDARLIMLPITAYAQADHAFKETTGEVLFRNHFIRGLDTLEPFAAVGGRWARSDPFTVIYSWKTEGLGQVGAVPAVVFVKTK